jgi:UDP-glucose 4-epimerase
MSTVLVTGGAGFMGSHVADALIARGDRVVVLDDLSGGFIENVPEEATFVEGSVNDVELVNSLFEQHRFDYVYHLAAYAAEGLSHFIKRFNYENNLIGSVNLINAAVNFEVKCFVFTSSIAVYGKNQVPMDEDMTPMPEDPYGIAKLAVEMELRASHEMFGLNHVIFRPHNVYGERQNIGDRYRNVAGIFMNQLMQNQPMTIFGDGEQTRAFSYISDVAPIIAEAPHVSRALNRVFNVGADTPYSVNTLARYVAKAMGCPLDMKHLQSRNEVVHAFSAHNRVREVFGYTAQVSLEEGVQRMAWWARAVGAKKSKPFASVEVLKNMPRSWRTELHAVALAVQDYLDLPLQECAELISLL